MARGGKQLCSSQVIDVVVHLIRANSCDASNSASIVKVAPAKNENLRKCGIGRTPRAGGVVSTGTWETFC